MACWGEKKGLPFAEIYEVKGRRHGPPTSFKTGLCFPAGKKAALLSVMRGSGTEVGLKASPFSLRRPWRRGHQGPLSARWLLPGCSTFLRSHPRLPLPASRGGGMAAGASGEQSSTRERLLAALDDLELLARWALLAVAPWISPGPRLALRCGISRWLWKSLTRN